jgi:hypothetical protein
MKASNKIPGPLFDKKDLAKLPDWAKTLIAVISLAIVPLFETATKFFLLQQISEVASKLFGR